MHRKADRVTQSNSQTSAAFDGLRCLAVFVTEQSAMRNRGGYLVLF
jgi:hypothetical protein